jgi:hypothetical protein
MSQTLRGSFEVKYNQDSCLRSLAREIATLDGSEARTIGLYDLKDSVDYPANFLVNGSAETFVPISTTHHERDSLTLYDLARWKFNDVLAFNAKSSRYGFNNPFNGSRGVSLLFDPLVDAFIQINRTAAVRKSLVIVLTDFYPYSSCYSDMVTEMDWGSELTCKYLDGSETGATLNALTSALNATSTHPNAIGLEKFVDVGVFLWNFFPFFRGGSYHSSEAGLPKTAKWLPIAWHWLNTFLRCVDSHTVIFASSDWVFPEHANSNDCGKDLSQRNVSQFSWNWSKRDLDSLPRDLFVTLSCAKLFRLHHPAAWNRQRRNEEQERMPEIFRRIVEQWRQETGRL